MAFVINNRKPLSRYRPPPHRSLRPLPPRWADHEDAMTRSPLAQFIVLSMLLHAMAIMLFGAPSGGSREGRAMWGSLNVVIRGPLREEKVEAPAPRAPPKPATPPKPRAIPEKRSVIPDASKEATVGNPASPPIPPLLTIPPEAAPERPPTFEVPPPSAPQPAPAPPVELPQIRPIELPAMPRLERHDPLPVEPLPAPPPPRAPEKELPPIRLDALPRMEAPPPPLPAPLVQPQAPSIRALPEVRPAVEAPAISSTPAPPVEVAPRAVERVEAPPKPAPAAEPPRVEPPRAETPRLEPRIEAPAVQPSPFRPPAAAAGPRKDEPSSNYDPTAGPPSLDAEALRKRAGELARQGTGQRAVLAFPMPPIPARKSKMEEAIENARKPDCRTAYQSLGLAAVVPLIANQFGEGTCRW